MPRAMILAAGRGERLAPLTQWLPKPLVDAGGKPLIVWHLERLKSAGFDEVVINTSHLGSLIQNAVGSGDRLGLSIHYSAEEAPLETAGGIARALPFLRTTTASDEPFLVVNGDIYTDFSFAAAHSLLRAMPPSVDAHLVLVDNPEHHPQGDFSLRDGFIGTEEKRHTFSGIGCYRPSLFAALGAKVVPLIDVLRPLIATQRISGEYHAGLWFDAGSPERLQQLRQTLLSQT